jgi:hypothetical protein
VAAQPRLRAEGDEEHRRVPTTRAHWRDAPSSACLRHRVEREQAVWTLAGAALALTIDLEARQRQQSPWLHLTREQLGFFGDVGEELR